MEQPIIALVEVSTSCEINMLIHKEENALIYFMNNFEFGSGKSLVDFLETYKTTIIAKLNDEVCEKLEIQNYFDYLSEPWYSVKYNDIELVSPESLLKIVMDENIITQKHIYKYLLSECDGYKYEIKKFLL